MGIMIKRKLFLKVFDKIETFFSFNVPFATMSQFALSLFNYYKYYTEDLTSPATKEWFLVGNPHQLAIILATYYYFCKHLGPQLMKDRKPFDITNLLIVFNAIQIILNAYIVCQFFRYVFFFNYDFRCQALETNDAYLSNEVAKGVYGYYLVKITDLLDTVFFVLRKSNRQITSLHLHHHMIMPVISWMFSTYYPGGQNVLCGSVNAFVHIVMYSYYLIAGLGEKYKKYLWWKKYLTMLQLIQFIGVGLHHLNSLRYDCGYPKFLTFLVIYYCIFFTNSFSRFYYNTYIKKDNQKQKNKQSGVLTNGKPIEKVQSIVNEFTNGKQINKNHRT